MSGESTVEERYEAFLRGERPDDILVYLHEEGVGSMESLLDIGVRVDDGVVLVLPGDEGRAAFQQATGLDAMDFAGMAMQTDGAIDDDCTGGTCPDADTDDDHYVKFVFAFVEEQNEGVGGIYADGDVAHGYAACACGTTYSEKWVLD
ncbi:uncharacterized protein NP_1370A [Natronomonas pharaonis DSM 2160]|uniref:Uncharacterized protein n=1 Tax=Natronomonas pharaonis (strain ATCC 35678 / DSM 2160 / CIP 103997 / JCM 8858 / NBRC 14720 / NCIMB 2260 / Gabara) TaxID=348780 RepID=A0A1U7EUX4_NATPD|nr:DUF5807 family protein [Natronomonas pharaonis]CAI48776.1 uncharacterized protein NP_1370A [Natronomonas pharaonis DSM 2160]